jgi:hypothetical protein
VIKYAEHDLKKMVVTARTAKASEDEDRILRWDKTKTREEN